MQFFIAFSGLLNGFAGVALLLYSYFQDSKRVVLYRVFRLMNVAVIVWGFSYWFWLRATDMQTALLWIKFVSLGAIWIPIFYLHWILQFFNLKQRKFLVFQYVLGGVFTLINLADIFGFTNLMVEGVRPIMYFSFWPKGGWIYLAYIVFVYIGASAYIIKVLLDQYWTDIPQRQQIKYIFLASFIGYTAGFTNFPLWFDIKVPPLGNVLVMLYMFFISYAMIRYRLMDVKMVTTEFFTAMLLILLGVQVFRSSSPQDLILNIGIFATSCVFAVLLIRGIIEENKFKDRITSLAVRLQQANHQLKKLDEAKSDFISTASHQLRTPLTAIRGYLSLILDETYGKPNPKIAEVIHKLMNISQGLLALVNDLLNLSRIESGKIQYDLKPLSLTGITGDILSELQPIANAKNIKLIWNHPSTLPLVLADEEKIRQVIMNLIDNAIKYTPQGSVTVSLESSETNVTLRVRDTGMGIDPLVLPTLFQKFVRSDESKHVNANGTGLGLYVGKTMIEAHRGKIWAASEGLGKGSEFGFSLPISQSKATPEKEAD